MAICLRTQCLLFAGLSALALSSGAQITADTLPGRVQRQNKLFEEYFQIQLKEFPEVATSLGDDRYNAILTDDSIAGTRRRHLENDSFLTQLNAIPTDGMREEDRLSHDMLRRLLEEADEDYFLKTWEMPVNQIDSPATTLADLPLSMPFNSTLDYENYIARLRLIPTALQQTIAVMRAGEHDGLMPVKYLLEQVPAQCEGVISSNPYLLPTKKFPASIPEAKQNELTSTISDVLRTEVFPAYRQFATFVRTDYAPHGRTSLSVESLPNGKARYALAVRQGTTLQQTPAAVHALGLREVQRITAEMRVLAVSQGYKDLVAWRRAIDANPKWKPASADQIVEDFRRYILSMQPKLPTLFNILPRQPVSVEAMPPFEGSTPTHYDSGTVDGSRPGRVVVAVANPASRTLVSDEAVAYHEGVPGHHMQISISQQLTDLPRFRSQLTYYNAYSEGWALYAEGLGKEIGLYQDPVSDYGRLNSELFRAVRLVVDTGIHDLGWTRQQVIDYMHANDVNDTLAQAETDRYIVWPGQALGYKVGQLEIYNLRERAKARLGAKFDIRAFHDEVLSGGGMPLDLLGARVNRWIATQLQATVQR